MPPTPRAPRSMRYVLAPSKGLTTLGTAYTKGTPIIEIKSMAGIGQTHYVLPSEIEALVKTEPQPYRTDEQIAASQAKMRATKDARAHIYGLEKCVMEELVKIPFWNEVVFYKSWSRQVNQLSIQFSRCHPNKQQFYCNVVIDDKIVVDYHHDFIVADPNVFARLAAFVAKKLKL